MSNGMKALDDVIREIIYNLEIHNLMVNPYREIVQFQDNECRGMTQPEKGRPSLSKEGFQIGEPFDGDIEHAPILFLSSNPAFNFDEVSPRYSPSSSRIFMPKHIVSADTSTVPQREMTFKEIKDFFTTRIQTSPAQNDDDETLRIPLKNGETKEVSYWGSVRNNTEMLLPQSLTASKQWKALTPSKRAREIMRYAVCMEIVPFRSSSEIGVNEKLLNECWEKYTKHLLALSGASVIVLVGNKVLDCFTSHIDPNAKEILAARSISTQTIGGSARLVVKVDFAQGAMRIFNTFFSAADIMTLQNAVANTQIVADALKTINANNN